MSAMGKSPESQLLYEALQALAAPDGEVLAEDLLSEERSGQPPRRRPRSLQRVHLQITIRTNTGTLRADQMDQLIRAEQQRLEELRESVHGRAVFLGTSLVPTCSGLLGWDDLGRPVGLSLDGGQIVMAMGVLGTGKSHLASCLLELFLDSTPELCAGVMRPAAGIVFHTNQVNATLPELLEALRDNPNPADLELLASALGVTEPGPIRRMRLAVPKWLLAEYEIALQPYVALGLEVVPLQLRPSRLSQTALEALLGGGDAQYVQVLLQIAEEKGEALDLAAWHAAVDEATDLNQTTRAAAHRRLRLLQKISSPAGGPDHWDLVEPGVLTILMMAGSRIGRADVMPLSVALLAALSEPSPRHGPFQRVFHLDEINRFDRDPVLWPVLVQVARQIRHQGSTLILMGQDFLGTPDEMLGLVTVFVMFRTRSPKLFDHARDRVQGFRGWTAETAGLLPVGTALVAVVEATDQTWPVRARPVRFRPLCCAHGGHTRAVL